MDGSKRPVTAISIFERVYTLKIQRGCLPHYILLFLVGTSFTFLMLSDQNILQPPSKNIHNICLIVQSLLSNIRLPYLPYIYIVIAQCVCIS